MVQIHSLLSKTEYSIVWLNAPALGVGDHVFKSHYSDLNFMIHYFENFFFLFFSSITLSLAILIIQSKNPVHSVLFLVLVFINIMSLLLLLKIEFFAILLIIIYVGAIAILFLFVVMMLDIKNYSFFNSTNIQFFPLSIIILSLFFFEFYFLIQQIFPFSYSYLQDNIIFLKKTYYFWVFFIDTITNVETIGQILYTYYAFLFLLSGIILLIALIGVVMLTFKRKNSKQQQLFTQLSRKSKNAIFLIKNKKGE